MAKKKTMILKEYIGFQPEVIDKVKETKNENKNKKSKSKKDKTEK